MGLSRSVEGRTVYTLQLQIQRCRFTCAHIANLICRTEPNKKDQWVFYVMTGDAEFEGVENTGVDIRHQTVRLENAGVEISREAKFLIVLCDRHYRRLNIETFCVHEQSLPTDTFDQLRFGEAYVDNSQVATSTEYYVAGCRGLPNDEERQSVRQRAR